MQLGLIVLLAVKLLSRVVEFNGLGIEVHQILHIVGARVTIAFLDLHLQLEHPSRKVHWQVLLLEVQILLLLPVLMNLVLPELVVKVLKIHGSP